MKKVNKEPFSNGTEYALFEYQCCDKCIKLAVSLCGLLLIAVFFNIKLPQLFKTFKDKKEKAFAIVALVSYNTLLLCLLILIVNGIIGMI